MEGALWAATAGVSFGLFQAVNRRGGVGADAFLATFVLLLVSAAALGAVTLATQDLAAATAAPPSAFAWFALASGVHYLLGWTFLSLAQGRIGASKTSVLAGTTPLFGTAVAYLVLDESVRATALAGVLLVVVGIVLMSLARAGNRTLPAAGGGLAFGFLTALCWAISPVFIRWGLEGLPSPLIGVTIGMTAAATAYGVALALRGRPPSGWLTRDALGWLLLAGVLVAFGTAGQWIALDLAPVSVVVALNQLAVPVVVLTSPLILGRDTEPFSGRIALGGATVLAGTMVILLSRGAAGG